MVRFYTCPKCTRLLVTAADGGPAPHDCVIPTLAERVVIDGKCPCDSDRYATGDCPIHDTKR